VTQNAPKTTEDAADAVTNTEEGAAVELRKAAVTPADSETPVSGESPTAAESGDSQDVAAESEVDSGNSVTVGSVGHSSVSADRAPEGGDVGTAADSARMPEMDVAGGDSPDRETHAASAETSDGAVPADPTIDDDASRSVPEAEAAVADSSDTGDATGAIESEAPDASSEGPAPVLDVSNPDAELGAPGGRPEGMDAEDVAPVQGVGTVPLAVAQAWTAADRSVDEGSAWNSAGEANPVRLLPWVQWRYSLILPLAIVLVVASVAFGVSDSGRYFHLTVEDQASGAPLPGAMIAVGTVSYKADNDGSIRIDAPESGTLIVVSADGYESMSGDFTSSSRLSQNVTLRARK
jgi:hypothetical protein